MRDVPRVKRFTVVIGHYGSGKTNLSINLALDMLYRYETVTLVDLDIVNPYFRSSDYARWLTARGVQVISPTFAGSTLDVPSLPAAISGVFDSPGAVIFDVGGDDVGATALGRYAGDLANVEHDMLYVINRYRNLTATPAEAAALLREIEAACHLEATGIVNNSHLKDETTDTTVLDSMDYAHETAALLDLPLVCTTVPVGPAGAREDVTDGADLVENAYHVEVYVRTPWEDGPGVDEEVM